MKLFTNKKINKLRKHLISNNQPKYRKQNVMKVL